MILRRNFRQYWRSPEFSLNRLAVVALFALIFSSIFFQQKLRDVADVQSRVILLFFFISLMATYNMYTIIPFALARRALFYRERATGMYSLFAFMMSEGVVEVPYLVVETLLGTFIVQMIVGLSTTPQAIFFFVTGAFFLVMMMSLMGLFFAHLMPDALSAQLSAIAFMQTLQIFSGILVPQQNISNPVYMALYYASPFRWGNELVVTSQFKGDDTEICLPTGIKVVKGLVSKLGVCTKDGSGDMSKITGIVGHAEQFLQEEFLPDYRYEWRYYDFLVMLLWICALRGATVLVIMFVSHNKR